MIAAVVRELVAAGLSGDALVAAIERIEAAELASITLTSGGRRVDETAEKRREWDREYQRKKRESGGRRVDNRVDVDSALYLKEGLKEEVKKERAKRKTGTELPVDAKPTEAHFAEGQKLGINVQRVNDLFEDMRLWARANGHRAVAHKSDWDATFTGWMRRACPRPVEAHHPTGPPPPAGLTAEQAEDWKTGWRPGMPSSKEIMARMNGHGKTLI